MRRSDQRKNEMRRLLTPPTTPQNYFKGKLIITVWKSHCYITWQDIIMGLVV